MIESSQKMFFENFHVLNNIFIVVCANIYLSMNGTGITKTGYQTEIERRLILQVTVY